MCRNHSHLVGSFIGIIVLEGVEHEAWALGQDLTIETHAGVKYTRPLGSIFLMPFLRREDLSALVLLGMEELYGFTVEPVEAPSPAMAILQPKLNKP